MDFSESLQASLAALSHAQAPLISQPPSLIDVAASFSAGEVVQRLEGVFAEFERSLNPDQEIGVALASFGVSHQVIVTSVGALGRSLVVIRGFEGDRPVSLVQHVSQLNFLLIPLPRSADEENAPRRKIGFQTA